MSTNDPNRPSFAYQPTTGSNTRHQEPATEPTGFSFYAELGFRNGPDSAVPRRRPQTTFSVNNPQFPARPEEAWRLEPTLKHCWNPEKTYTEASYTKNYVIRPQSFITRRNPWTMMLMGTLVPLTAVGGGSYAWSHFYKACDARVDDWKKATNEARTKISELEQKIASLESSCQGTGQLQRRDPVWVSEPGRVGEQEDEEEVKLWWVPSEQSTEEGKSSVPDSALETTSSGDV